MYRKHLNRLNTALTEKCSSLLNKNSIILLHDNEKSHVLKDTQEHLKVRGWEVLAHPPHSPDFASTDYYLLRSLGKDIHNKTYMNQDFLANN